MLYLLLIYSFSRVTHADTKEGTFLKKKKTNLNSEKHIIK